MPVPHSSVGYEITPVEPPFLLMSRRVAPAVPGCGPLASRAVLVGSVGQPKERASRGVARVLWVPLPGLVRRPAFTLLMYKIEQKKNTAFYARTWDPRRPQHIFR